MKKKFIKQILKALTISLLFLILFFAAYSFIFLDKTPANTFFANLNISGRSESQLKNIIGNGIKNFEKEPQRILVGNNSLEIPLSDLGVYIDSQRTTDNIITKSIIGNLFEIQKTAPALFVFNKFSPVYEIDTVILTKTLDSKFDLLEKEAIEAEIVVENGIPALSKSENGLVIDRSKLIEDLKQNINNLSTNPVFVNYAWDEPTISTSHAIKAFEKVGLLNEQNINFAYELESWPLKGESLLKLLSFKPRGFQNENLLQIPIREEKMSLLNIYYLGKESPTLEATLQRENVDALINEMAGTIDQATVDANLEFDGVKVSRFTPARDGRSLDKIQVRNIILNLFSVDNLAFEKNVNINLPVTVTKAKIANDEINSLGIKELIASGVSYFSGSIPNRVFNIGLGSEFINGVIVPPGDVFSFNKLVGPVSSEQGFKEAYVISRGRTVLDDGGGICQVSTTTFRAALNAGLPIVERTAHAYRVSYYEQRGFEPGYDATIWSPTVDLKFKNDTGHHILVQAIVDRAASKLQVDIYGTSDGRTVELTNPVLTNRRPAPEPLYQDDPSLPTGTVKQVDWAAEGLTSVFNRTVTKNGETLIDESFKSNFRPWQAVYLVGKGG